MARFKNFFEEINWKYSIGEILLIVIGILIAFTLNSWKDNIRQEEEEVRLLSELKRSLQRDLEDIESSRAIYESGDRSINLILDHLKSKKPYNDTLKVHFANTVLASVFLEDRGTYETLNYKGRDIISSDVLRVKVASLYAQDYEYLKKVEEIDFNHLVNNVVPYYSKNFKNFKFGETAAPVNYEELINDDYYFGLLEWLRTDRIFLIDRLGKTGTQIKNLIVLIDKEIVKIG